MSSLFSKPKMPSTPKVIDTSGAEAEAEATRLRERRSTGRASTMLTGGQLNQTNIGTTKLLGR